VLVGAVAALAPWTARNQRLFGSPVLVSANGGWNLLIGTDPEAHGGWRALDPPEGCREVWGEVDKDACFRRAARARILDEPAAWLALAPSKLGATFDLGGSGPSYLSRARPDLVPRAAVLVVGGVETAFERLSALAVLLALGFAPGEGRGWRRVVAVVSSLFVLVPHAWPAYLGLAALLVPSSACRLDDQPARLVTLGVLASTLATHAVFFGAGRYALLVHPWIAALACVLLPATPPGPGSVAVRTGGA